MELRNVAWCRRVLSGIVNFNQNQTDQDFNSDNDAYYHLDDALSEAYDLEVNEGRARSTEAFKRTASLTWPVGQVTLPMPAHIAATDIIELYDVTDISSGRLLIVGDRAMGSHLFWLDDHTLQWSNEGPQDTKSLQVTFVAAAQELRSAVQVPDLIASRYRHLLLWSAAVILSKKAEQSPQQAWVDQRDDWRTSWYTSITQGRPSHQNIPRVRNHRRRAYGR